MVVQWESIINNEEEVNKTDERELGRTRGVHEFHSKREYKQ